MRFELIVLDGSGKRFPLPQAGEVLIGSAAECAIRLTANDVSRRHALLILRRGTISLLDLGSKNGTFLAGERIKEARVSPGELLRFSSVLTQLIPLGIPSDPAGEVLGERTSPRARRAPSPTAEVPAVPDSADLGWLLARWGRGGGDAMAAALEWISTRAAARGAAFLRLAEGDAVVVAASGDVGSILASATLASTLGCAGSSVRAPEVAPIQCGVHQALAIRCEEGCWLVLAVGDVNPTAAQVELFAQLAAVALRLDG